MSAKKFNSQNLLSIVDLEISMIERYYKNTNEINELSLIYFNVPQELSTDTIFEKILRRTDAYIQEDTHFIAILYATNKIGASELLSGIQEFLNAKPIDCIVSYPQDAKNAKELLIKLCDDIKDNYGFLLECLKISDPINIYEF